jgi:hypothetical protein
VLDCPWNFPPIHSDSVYLPFTEQSSGFFGRWPRQLFTPCPPPSRHPSNPVIRVKAIGSLVRESTAASRIASRQYTRTRCAAKQTGRNRGRAIQRPCDFYGDDGMGWMAGSGGGTGGAFDCPGGDGTGIPLRSKMGETRGTPVPRGWRGHLQVLELTLEKLRDSWRRLPSEDNRGKWG